MIPRLIFVTKNTQVDSKFKCPSITILLFCVKHKVTHFKWVTFGGRPELHFLFGAKQYWVCVQAFRAANLSA